MKIRVIDFGGVRPDRAHYNDSGADIFATESVDLYPFDIEKVPTGIGLDLPDGYDAVIHCKSGLASKGIVSMNAPIDAGYTGQIYAIMTNLSNRLLHIEKGEKIGQIVIRPVIYAEFVSTLGEERKDGAFGSTGK